MRRKLFVGSATSPRVLGAKSTGVTKKVTAEIVQNLRKKFDQSGRSVTVKAMRFIPSSLTITENGSFQVVANTVIEEKSTNSSVPRSETLDSVVTVGRTGRVQKLEGLTIPALQRVAS